MFKTNINLLKFYNEGIFFLPIFPMIIYKVQTLPSLSRIPGRKQKEQIFENRSIWLHIPYTFRDSKY